MAERFINRAYREARYCGTDKSTVQVLRSMHRRLEKHKTGESVGRQVAIERIQLKVEYATQDGLRIGSLVMLCRNRILEKGVKWKEQNLPQDLMELLKSSEYSTWRDRIAQTQDDGMGHGIRL